MAPRASLQGQRGGGGAAPLRPSLAGAGSGKQLLPLVAGSGAGGGSGIGGGAAGRAYNTAELVEQLLQQQALGALALPNGPSGGGPLGPGRKISMGPLAAAGSAAAAAAAAAGGMGAAVKRNPARRMSASGAMGDGAGGSGGGGGGGGSVMANRRPAGGFAAGPTAPHLGGGFAGAGANSNAAASTGAPSLGRLSVPVNASSAVPQPFTAGSGVTGTRAQLAGPSGRQRRMSDLVAGSGAAAGAGLASQPSATALLPGLPQAPSGLAPDAAASGAQYSQHLPMRARSFVLGEHSSVSASGVPPPHPGAGGGAGGGLPLAPIRTGRVSQTGGASGSPANGPGTAIMAALLANMGAGTGGAATAGGSAGHHGPAHAPHLRPASGGLHSGAGPGGLPLPPSAMLQGHGLGTGLGSAANSPLAAVAAGGGAFARLTAQSSASSFGESSPGLPLRRRHSYVGSPTPSSGGGEAMPPAPGPNSGGGLGGVDGVAMLHMQGQGQGAVPHGVSGNVGSGGSMSGPVGAAAVAAALGRAGGGSGSGKASPATGSPRSFTHGSMVPRQVRLHSACVYPCLRDADRPNCLIRARVVCSVRTGFRQLAWPLEWPAWRFRHHARRSPAAAAHGPRLSGRPARHRRLYREWRQQRCQQRHGLSVPVVTQHHSRQWRRRRAGPARRRRGAFWAREHSPWQQSGANYCGRGAGGGGVATSGPPAAAPARCTGRVWVAHYRAEAALADFTVSGANRRQLQHLGYWYHRSSLRRRWRQHVARGDDGGRPGGRPCSVRTVTDRLNRELLQWPQWLICGGGACAGSGRRSWRLAIGGPLRRRRHRRTQATTRTASPRARFVKLLSPANLEDIGCWELRLPQGT